MFREKKIQLQTFGEEQLSDNAVELQSLALIEIGLNHCSP